MRVWAFIAVGMAISAGVARAGDAVPLDTFKVYNNLAMALALEGVCPTWRLDHAETAQALLDAGLIHDVHDAPASFRERFDQLNAKAQTLDEDTACDMAEMLFGPDGTAARSWMKRR
jgi:hypothetical protein